MKRKKNNNDSNSNEQHNQETSKKRKKKTLNENVQSNDESIKLSNNSNNSNNSTELARIRMSIDDMNITDVEIMSNSSKISNKHEEQTIDVESSSDEKVRKAAEMSDVSVTVGTEKIWKYLALGKVNMMFAQIGTSMNGQPILDHELLTTTLVTYGFNIDDALNFINDFVENTQDDKTAPIIMINTHMSDIMDVVEPLE